MVIPFATICVGTWHEKEAREIRVNPSYYAADWMKIRTTPGDYVANLAWDLHGYLIPVPQYLQVGIASEILDGKLYSGIGGVNYASSSIEPGPYTFSVNAYSYKICDLVKDGTLSLNPDWEWLSEEEHLPYVRNNYTKEQIFALSRI